MKRFTSSPVRKPHSLLRGAVVFILTILFSGGVYAETASWYSTEACQFNKNKLCPTASGQSLYELERKGIDFAAMWDVPFGERREVCNKRNHKCVEVVILDRGASKRFVPRREIDLSKSAFRKIAELSEGIIQVTIKEIK